MQISVGERLILVMLAEIYKRLEIDGDINPELVLSAISSGNTWALDWEYAGFLREMVDEKVVEETTGILGMWRSIELAMEELPAAERERVKADVKPFSVEFEGFDGNHEDHFGVAQFLINEMGRFAERKGKPLNSHSRSIDGHRARLRAYEKILETKSLAEGPLTSEELVEILRTPAR